ncbi:putative UPF0481 protein [Camellia lanceoleosa]|nr:putative UPF0481 protein [Camellia lanceoleosa]
MVITTIVYCHHSPGTCGNKIGFRLLSPSTYQQVLGILSSELTQEIKYPHTAVSRRVLYLMHRGLACAEEFRFKHLKCSRICLGLLGMLVLICCKEKENEIRSRYHMYLGYNGNTLLWFMTIDGLLLLNFLHTCISKEDRLSSSWSRTPNLFESAGSKFVDHSILRDVVMLENQIPIFLLGNIFDFLDIDKNVLLSMVTGFCSEVSPFKLIKKDLSLSEVYEHDHLLKLLYHLIVMNVKVPKEA